MLLHTVNQSPITSTAWQSALNSLLPGAHILLLEDGVYAAVAGTAAADQLLALNDVHCHVLAADAATRGITHKLAEGIELISYQDFVNLSTECHAVQSWY
ncbi:sulfurtransferase complex subunit TusB [Halieaceae bacterium IMCC14734]|uniref:Sulfurtransferase complex subunit TusB n=1 Tax=Candidatus Litorirhabdus singularis TaxID=2518993 RepID=A0ABT3TJ02_9GAMM|nr:sulfurtransferase complex subunit TusB [Candidatus Litorirhabdus singularis]MCX2981389.1 sulfurtransferase complex subunit TusB [Candidatus Litorirhabdus singularis]